MDRFSFSGLRARRKVLLFIVGIGIRSYLIYLIRKSVTLPFPITGAVIGFLAGIFIDASVRETHISDNVLWGIVLSGLLGFYDFKTGLTLAIGPSSRITLLLIILAFLGAISALVNEMQKGYPARLGFIALVASILALVLFSLAVQTQQVTFAPEVNNLPDTYMKRIRYNTTANAFTGTGTLRTFATISSTNNNITTVTTSGYVDETDPLEAYLAYVYVPRYQWDNDNDTKIKMGTYMFTIFVSGKNDGVIRTINGSKVEVIFVVIANDLSGSPYRKTVYYDIVLNGTITFNITISAEIASMLNSGKYYARFELNFKPSIPIDSVNVVVQYYAYEIVTPNTGYIYGAIGLIALAVIDALPEFEIEVRRFR